MLCRDHDNILIGQINALQVQTVFGDGFVGCQATIIKDIRNKLADARAHVSGLAKENTALRWDGEGGIRTLDRV